MAALLAAAASNIAFGKDDSDDDITFDETYDAKTKKRHRDSSVNTSRSGSLWATVGFLVGEGGKGRGVELGLNMWPSGKKVGEGFYSSDGKGFGVFGQYQEYGESRMRAFGGQAFFGPFGVEVGREWVFGSDELDEDTYTRFAPFLTLGVVSVSKRIAADHRDETHLGPTEGWTLHLKVPLAL